MIRLLLIIFLAVLASTNNYLDLARPAFSNTMDLKAFLFMVAVGVGTAAPPLVAFLISSRTSFSIKGVNIYKLSSDLILFLCLLAWCYLVFVRERPEFYHGASHMYVATWPITIGLLAVILYISCLVIQLICSTWQKHNKALKRDSAKNAAPLS